LKKGVELEYQATHISAADSSVDSSIDKGLL